MNNSKNEKTAIFKGAGFLVGLATGIAAAVIIYAITGNIALTAPFIAAFGVPIGISFEKRFQGQSSEVSPKVKKALILAVVSGVIFFSLIYFIVKL